jgi:hypothetical protein
MKRNGSENLTTEDDGWLRYNLQLKTDVWRIRRRTNFKNMIQKAALNVFT